VSAGRGTTPDTPVTAAIEIRALYDDFREMAAAIDRRSRYLRDFAAAISHEFKTPLAGIGGAAELLQDHFETMSPAERRRFLDNIAADNRRLSRLVTRLLDLARADMARPEAGVAADLAASLRRTVDLQAESGPEITLDLPAGLPAVAVPEMTLETVMATLLENSRQAGATRVAISVRQLAGQVLIAVQDDGPGVAEADRDRLFEPFFTSRRAAGGTGLGLPIARSLLAASQGTIRWTASDSGARFEVRAPLA
jgi:signal transduction histidine kinase